MTALFGTRTNTVLEIIVPSSSLFFSCFRAGLFMCSNASLSGTYGFLHDGTDSNGTPATAAVSQIAFDPTTGTFTGETTASHDALGIAASLGTSFLFDDKSLLAVNTQRYIEYIFRGIVSPPGASKHTKKLVPLAH